VELRKRRHGSRELVGPRHVPQNIPLCGGESLGIVVSGSAELDYEFGNFARFLIRCFFHAGIIALRNYLDKTSTSNLVSLRYYM